MKFKNTNTNSLPVLQISESTRKVVFVILFFFCLTPFVTPPIALFFGVIVANLTGHPYLHLNHRATTLLLQVSVVGLGFGMNVQSALNAGSDGFLFTVASIVFTLLLGSILGKYLGIDPKVSHLISSGTAICGGSAIAAIAPVIGSDEKQTSIALGVIFILNSVALLLFPSIGHFFELTQSEFGFWSAIAIHDTSSVVGSANKYGNEALQIATTVKLARALWIIPVALVTSFIFKSKATKLKVPFFILWFIFALLLNSYFPVIHPLTPYLVGISKIGLTVTLFLIGAGLHRTVLLSVGFKPLFQGVILWLGISVSTLIIICNFK